MYPIVYAERARTLGGNRAKNTYLLTSENGVMLQSFNHNVLFKHNDGTIYLDKKYWDLHGLDANYRQAFLNESTAVTQNKILLNEYKLIDLNAQ